LKSPLDIKIPPQQSIQQFIFIRDDDVTELTPEFLTVFNLFKRYRIPVIYSIIPKYVTTEMVQFLNIQKARNFHLLDIVQHGYSHKNYGRRIKYEFGRGRSYIQQRKDILRGFRIMKKLFKDNFTPAFVPPYNRYNITTLKVLNELNIPILSARPSLIDKKYKNVWKLPILLSLNTPNTSTPSTIKEKMKELLHIISTKKKVIGINIHHRSFYSTENLHKLEIFIQFLINLRNIKFILFSHILNKDNYLGDNL